MPVLKSLATRAPGGARLHSRECQGVPMSVSAVNSNSNVAANTPQNRHTVQHGDTLSAIARQKGVSLATLLAAKSRRGGVLGRKGSYRVDLSGRGDSNKKKKDKTTKVLI